MRARALVFFVAATAVLSVVTSYSQSPTPVVVQAGAATATTVQAPAATDSDAAEATLKSLRELKAANNEILKKQKATLETLDQLQKAADQIKLFTSRT